MLDFDKFEHSEGEEEDNLPSISMLKQEWQDDYFVRARKVQVQVECIRKWEEYISLLEKEMLIAEEIVYLLEKAKFEY
jgi:hypothetical protein